MPWTNTVDERSAGTGLIYWAGTYDAQYSTATNYRISPRTYAYGALISNGYAEDKDAYSLGVLSPGVYAAFTSGYNWDVNGSWAAPLGSEKLADNYFTDLVAYNPNSMQLSQWGILSV